MSIDFAEMLSTSGLSGGESARKSAMLESCVSALVSAGKRDPRAVFVPGRIEFLGKHTDYAGGRSLICATEQGFCAAFAPRTDRAVRVFDVQRHEEAQFDFAADLVPTIGHWSNYPMTVARRVARNFGPDLRGADIAFASDLPAASGMSSSSAFMIAVFLALGAVNKFEHRPAYRTHITSREDLAGYLGTIENGQSFGTLDGDKGVGTFGGSQDHTAILCSKPGVLCQYSFAPVRLERDVPLPADHVLAIASSGVVAEKTAAAREKYNALSARVGGIMRLWREATNRTDPTLAAAMNSSPGAVRKIRALLADHDRLLLDRFEQCFAESEQIVPAVGDALAAGRPDAIGPLIDRSQQLAESLLGNQVAQTIFLQRTARELGAPAASAFGAGFGGSVWALVASARAAEFLDGWKQTYTTRFPDLAPAARFFTTRAGPAAICF